jgi:DNA-binding NarL/FixJ family response regulator
MQYIQPYLVTDRQIQIVQYIADGYKTNDIAEMLGITKKTVEVHLYNLYKKTELTCAAHAVAHFFRHKLIK